MGKLKYLGLVVGLGVLAALLVCCRFCPRVAIWKGLDIPDAQHFPEVQRANFVLKQEAHPFERIVASGSRGSEWRLLFPVIGHLFGLPPKLILFAPQLGCLVAACYIVHVLLARRCEKVDAFLAAMLVVSSTWFFCSMGWLGYEDSWCALGLLAIAFTDKRGVLGVICFMAPWIDERFVLGLPLAFSVRAMDRGWNTPEDRRKLIRDALVLVGAISPYLLLRVGTLGGNSATGEYIKTQYQESRLIRPGVILHGLWEGLRLGWLYVFFAIAFHFKKVGKSGRLLLGTIVVGTVMAASLVADDLSRNTVMFVPLILQGILIAGRARREMARVFLICCAILNLVLPAQIVVTLFSERMASAFTILAECRNPPHEVNASFYNNKATQLWNEGHSDEAMYNFDLAYRLDPDLPLRRFLVLRARGQRN